MADGTLKILGVHGLGNQQGSGWETKWTEAVRNAFPAAGIELSFEFVNYDDIFAGTELSGWEIAGAIFKLGLSGISAPFQHDRALIDEMSDKIKWTAGYVVAWCNDEGFQAASRKRILDAVTDTQPDIVLAHSLGSLVTYNAFSHKDAEAEDVADAMGKVNYVTFGSQLGNAFVLGNLTNGRLQKLQVKSWRHLFNPFDKVFTAPIRLPDMPAFSQTETPFDDQDLLDHSAESYLQNRATIANVWVPIANAGDEGRSTARTLGLAPTRSAEKVRPRRKALLVGINEYPDEAQRLEGCVNDVYTMSAVLQDSGFPPDAIRVCLDQRATADGIMSRLKWLLDDPRPDDELVFYYSGHGARIPEYGKDFAPDRHIETLVPWDFDWTPERAIADSQIYGLYSQLPYDTRLLMIFDCCHSGGIHRAGGPKPRGISPPDDIRHREIKWDSATQMWVPRTFERLNEDFAPKSEEQRRIAFFGRDGATERLGRAGMLRKISSTDYQRLKREVGDDEAKRTRLGPYLPLIIEACGEEELSYEYRHGASSHGAFTFVLDRVLRRAGEISFDDLVEQVGAQLKDLKFNQRPQLLGPTAYMAGNVPFRVPAAQARPAAS